MVAVAWFHPLLGCPEYRGSPSFGQGADFPHTMSGDTGVLGLSAEAGPMARDADTDLQPVLDALGDPDCRGLLSTIGEDALTALECSEAYDMPLSTTYRKLERLAEADLLVEEVRIRADGKHASEYRRDFESVCVSVGTGGDLSLSVSHSDA